MTSHAPPPSAEREAFKIMKQAQYDDLTKWLAENPNTVLGEDRVFAAGWAMGWQARASQVAAPPAQVQQTDITLEVLRHVRKALVTLGYATEESLESFGANINTNLYNLCRAVEAMRNVAPPALPASQEPIGYVTALDIEWLREGRISVLCIKPQPDEIGNVPVYITPQPPAQQEDAKDAEDAARWRFILKHKQYQGSTNGYATFKQAVDAAIAAAQKGEAS